jgi:hypothetical protein
MNVAGELAPQLLEAAGLQQSRVDVLTEVADGEGGELLQVLAWSAAKNRGGRALPGSAYAGRCVQWDAVREA